MRTLVVIPARGGSKGIPRKNLRPLGGRPLISWVIDAVRRAGCADRIVVTTDSEEIAKIAERLGADALIRDAALATDTMTLDPVVYDAVRRVEGEGLPYDLVLTVQPTSPLLRAETMVGIVRRFEHEDIDTVLTAIDDTHLAWTDRDGIPIPDYAARVNRQELPKRYRETGGVLATRRDSLSPSSRIGRRVGLHILSPTEGIDIDSADDWLFAEAALARRRIAFVVIGNQRQGLGHVSRAMTLMEGLTGHVTRAFCTPDQDLAISRFESAFFPVEVLPRGDMLSAIQRFGADIVVHDELDTNAGDLLAERAVGLKVVCFEDHGAGVELAHLLVNALYPEVESDVAKGRYCGPSVYVLREEFLLAERNDFRSQVRKVLLTFGGTDPNRLTLRVLQVLAPVCMAEIVVVAGKGFDAFAELEALAATITRSGARITLHRDVALMSEVMQGADLAFSSAGRTVYELAYMRVPTIVLAQNDLELKHTFASPPNGVLNLGLGSVASPEAIRATFQSLVTSEPLRRALFDRMAALDLTVGRQKVLNMILEAL